MSFSIFFMPVRQEACSRRQNWHFALTNEMTYPFPKPLIFNVKPTICYHGIFLQKSSKYNLLSIYNFHKPLKHHISRAKNDLRKSLFRRSLSRATRIRTLKWRSQSPLPYRLAIALFRTTWVIIHEVLPFCNTLSQKNYFFWLWESRTFGAVCPPFKLVKPCYGVWHNRLFKRYCLWKVTW